MKFVDLFGWTAGVAEVQRCDPAIEVWHIWPVSSGAAPTAGPKHGWPWRYIFKSEPMQHMTNIIYIHIHMYIWYTLWISWIYLMYYIRFLKYSRNDTCNTKKWYWTRCQRDWLWSIFWRITNFNCTMSTFLYWCFSESFDVRLTTKNRQQETTTKKT